MSSAAPASGSLSFAPGAACELIVVRHGETEWNKELRVQGSTDIELNAKGRLQAERCAEAISERLAKRGAAFPPAVWSSHLSRAAVTASAIAAGVGSDEGVRQDARLAEWDLGVLEGMRKDEAAQKHAEDWWTFSHHWAAPVVADDVASRVISGGESMLEVRRRVVACLEEACREALVVGRSTVVAVTHGGALGQVLKHAVSQLAADEVPATASPTNACISTFYVEPSGRWHIAAWAEADHLTGDAAPLVANYNAASSCAEEAKAEEKPEEMPAAVAVEQ